MPKRRTNDLGDLGNMVQDFMQRGVRAQQAVNDMTGPHPKFEIHQYADISTAYLEHSDLPLISNPEISAHIAETDDRAGCYWVVASDEEIFIDNVNEWRKAGLSWRFIAIMTELRRQGIPYVRFDADGGEVEGLEHTQEATNA